MDNGTKTTTTTQWLGPATCLVLWSSHTIATVHTSYDLSDCAQHSFSTFVFCVKWWLVWAVVCVVEQCVYVYKQLTNRHSCTYLFELLLLTTKVFPSKHAISVIRRNTQPFIDNHCVAESASTLYSLESAISSHKWCANNTSPAISHTDTER